MARKAVEEGEARWLTAFNGGDAAGVAAVYAPEARLMPPNADILEGRNAIEAFLKEFVQTGAQLSFKLLEVHKSPDMCAAVGTYEMEIPAGPDQTQQDRGKYLEVWAKQPDGGWAIVEDIFNSSLPA